MILHVTPHLPPDQAANAHPVDHSGQLRWRKVVDASEVLRRHVHVEGEEHMRLEAADTLDHQGRDVSVATVLAQQGSCVKETSHDVVGDRDRAQRGVHRPALERCAGRSLEQQVSRACERVRVDVIAQDPP